MNIYGQKARNYMMEYCPHQYRLIEDKEAYFTEIGEAAERQVSSTYSRISKPELGERDLAAKMMAEETIQDLLYPPAEKGHEEGWEVVLEDLPEDEMEEAAQNL